MDPVLLQNGASAWSQVAVVIAVGGALPALFRLRRPGLVHGYYRTLLAFALVLPALQPWPRPQLPAGAVPAASFAAVRPAVIETAVTSETELRAGDETAAALMLFTIVGGIAARLLWLAVGFSRLRRLRRSGTPLMMSAATEHLQRMFGRSAELRSVAALSHPVTFGLRRPLVLLPASLASLSGAQQQSVIAHELIHVRRADWLWVVVEEVLRAFLWFHPAIWWLISRIQLTREQVVDELTVLATGNRRAYMEALLAFADRPPFAPVTAFARRRHLFKRLALISKEAVMSARHVAISCVAMALMVALSGWYASSSFPLQAITMSDEQTGIPGPPPPAPPPPPEVAVVADGRVLKVEHRVEPAYPAAARAAAARGQITMALTIDPVGNVTRTAVRGIDVRTSKDVDATTLRDVTDAVIRAATVAAQQWRYEAPRATTSAYAVIAVVPPGEVRRTTQTVSARFATASERRSNAVRVGGNIRPPRKTYDVTPIYPEAAREAGIQGSVVIEAVIDETGAVSEARVLRGIPLLDQAALDAIRQWRFEPTLLNGAPVPVIMTLTIDFRTAAGAAPPPVVRR